MDDLNYFKIGELANLVGMSTRTIRYYEEIGLLDSIKRMEGGKRVYTDSDFQRLKFIKRLKHLGLTLSEMNELQSIYRIHGTNREMLSRLLELLDMHAVNIDERINNLIRLKEDIWNFQGKIRQRLNPKDEFSEGRVPNERSADH